MELIPAEVTLYDYRGGGECRARIVELSRLLAKEQIDGKWWRLGGVPASKRDEESDHHWVWRTLVGERRTNLAWEFVAVQTDDGEVQGAMRYRIDVKSFVSPENGTVYVDRLAAAPRNRPWLVTNPRFGGVGTSLILRAVCHSYTLGLEGRVSLISVPSERTRHFYEKLGFIATDKDNDGIISYELSAGAAQAWLRQKGVL